MLFAPLPTLSGPCAPRTYPWGRETIVVHDRTTHAVYEPHTAPLSLKTVLRGAERYNVHGFFEAVTPGDYLIVNEGQTYRSAIEEEGALTETLCIFFTAPDLDEVTRAAGDWIEPSGSGGIEFAAVMRRLPPRLSEAMRMLPRLRDQPALARQSAALRLIGLMIEAERGLAPPLDGLSAVRAATRQELRRRCEIGKAFLLAHLSGDPTLADAAAAAGLSRAHFLRAFKACVGETPHQMLKRVRLERAMEVMREGRRSVSEVALALGYGDFSAFARAFRAHFGVAPSSVRK